MAQMVDARPGTASVRVTDFGWQGLLNPNPINKEEDECLVDEYLSPAKLQILTGVEDLSDVKALQMCVDTRENSLGNFGTYMPNLRQLKLNNSIIMSIRDLGTSLSQLQVLWLARCGLSDLDGISSLCSLKELYLAYNNLSDLSQVSMLEHLEILDLEGNNLDNITELQYLALCSNLTVLSLEGNSICTKPSPEATESPDYNYRFEVHKIIPHLKFLDDVPAEKLHTDCPHTPTHDWLIVKDYIKDTSVDQLGIGLGSGNIQRRTSLRPSTAQSSFSGRPYSAVRPASAGRPATSHQGPLGSPQIDPINSDEGTAEDEASDLTHGVGRVICGNPFKALRARKERLVPASLITHQSMGHRPECTFDPEFSSEKNRDDVFAELRAWRTNHHELLQKIQSDRAPQVLTIQHSEEEEGSSLYDSSGDEEAQDPWDSSCLIRVSPENLSPLPIDQSSGEDLQDVTWVPSPPLTPCPPHPGSRNSNLNKGADIRMRRLLKGPIQRETMAPRQMNRGFNIGDEAFSLSDIDGVHPKMSETLKMNEARTEDFIERPLSEPVRIRPYIPRSPVDKNSPKVIPSHQPVIRTCTKTPERPAPAHILRPITARGILQRLPNRPTLLAGSKIPNT
ncbi:leucine-rich repeat-containing protein 56 [Bombina bombina]|uniref:leucine-rich repeat-containing protein 56 n=1 Tax=Bombina bombina TaxID=8345 RepID=UPI00235B1F9D|nr:leucine-rich repeat-containing protein 56 [Bombina bombina]